MRMGLCYNILNIHGYITYIFTTFTTFTRFSNASYTYLHKLLSTGNASPMFEHSIFSNICLVDSSTKSTHKRRVFWMDRLMQLLPHIK